MKRSRARLYAGTKRNLAFLARQLRAGELVAVPTETVYGLAANALDAKACAKIFRAKGRPTQDPLIVHIHALAQLEHLCVPSPAALKVARTFWPGALTLVLPKTNAVPSIVTAGRDSVAVRMPANRLFRQLLKLAKLPLAAPSANPFGYISPTTADHVLDGLGDKIRFILDGGEARIGVESTILDLRDPLHATILRPGAITAAALGRVLGRPVVVAKRKAVIRDASAGQIAPGMLARHYSPRTPVTLHSRIPSLTQARGNPSEAFVHLKRPKGPSGPNVFWFDRQGDLAVVARGLFSLLRRLDGMKFQRIHVQRAPDRGLGLAINDRLTRAAAR